MQLSFSGTFPEPEKVLGRGRPTAARRDFAAAQNPTEWCRDSGVVEQAGHGQRYCRNCGRVCRMRGRWTVAAVAVFATMTSCRWQSCSAQAGPDADDGGDMYCGNEDCYHVLGTDRWASPSALDIRKAYRRLSKAAHPDRNRGDPSAVAKFQRIGRAYETLIDPEMREDYVRAPFPSQILKLPCRPLPNSKQREGITDDHTSLTENCTHACRISTWTIRRK